MDTMPSVVREKKRQNACAAAKGGVVPYLRKISKNYLHVGLPTSTVVSCCWLIF